MKRWTRPQGLEDQVTYLQLLRRDALLKNFGFQPQVLRVVHTAPFEGSHVVGPEPKVLQQREHNIRHADRMSGSSVTFQKMTKVATTSQVTKKTPKVKTVNRPGLLCLTVWGLQVNPPFRGPSHRTRSPFVQSPSREAIDVPMCTTIASLLEQPRLQQQADVDMIQVGACLAGFAPQRRSPVGPPTQLRKGWV